jgi:hypothetical protein
MKKMIFSLFLVVLLIFLAYQRRPDLATHQARILARAALLSHQGEVTLTSKPALPPLSFHDLYLVTTTSDPLNNTWVSFGFGNYIKILNDDWGQRALLTLPATLPR